MPWKRKYALNLSYHNSKAHSSFLQIKFDFSLLFYTDLPFTFYTNSPFTLSKICPAAKLKIRYTNRILHPSLV